MTMMFGGNADCSRKHCAVMVPPDPPLVPPLPGMPPQILLSAGFLAKDIVTHVARAFQYTVDTLVAHTLPPANFARDLDIILATDVMIFDLSWQNPEICFAAGLRYMTARPMVCFVQQGERVPHSLAHLRPIEYAHATVRDTEAEFIRRMTLIVQNHRTEGRPFFEVHSPESRKVIIGDFILTRDVLADVEDRVHGGGVVAKGRNRGGMGGSRGGRY